MNSAPWVLSVLQLAGVPADASRELDAALQALSEADFESALAQADAGLRRTQEPARVARLHLVRGEVYAALRQYAQMEAAFARALEADPDARLDPERVQPTCLLYTSDAADE